MSPGERLLDRDQTGDDRHPNDAHDPERKERRHQRPAAADTPGAVPHSHPERAGPPVAPRAEQYAKRAAALAQTRILERRKLVDGGGDEGRSGDPAADERDREGYSARGRPRNEIARNGATGPVSAGPTSAPPN